MKETEVSEEGSMYKSKIKFSVSNAISAGTDTASVFVSASGVYKEAVFVKADDGWKLSKDCDWDVVTYINPDMTIRDETCVKNMVKKVILQMTDSAPEELIRTVEAGDERNSFFQGGFKYEFSSVNKTYRVYDGLSLGYSFDDGVAVEAVYKRCKNDISKYRAAYDRKVLKDEIFAVEKAFITTDTDISLANGTILHERGELQLIQLNGKYYTQYDSRVDVCRYINEIKGLREYTIGITTYGAQDEAQAAVEQYLSIANKMQ